MRKISTLTLCVVELLLFSSCSPRDFLTRRLAADLIATSTTFRAVQPFELTTGVISNEDYLSPNYLALQHRGWISGTVARCPPAVTPPCWDVTLTPSGVDTFQSLLAPADAESKSFSIPAARRELVAITGIAKQGNVADIEFTWRWIPLNEVGAIMYSSDTRYRSTAAFRSYDDGWRVVEAPAHSGQPLDEALKNAQAAQ
ncbi:MAG: hypothetical protein JWQ87_1978 [Candidatus Sulfotelmatobacter sp.]|nr:hypothetical protein [Candidatus Sulfotelmatobacter sp.]